MSGSRANRVWLWMVPLLVSMSAACAGCDHHAVGACQSGRCTGCCRDDVCEPGDRNDACGVAGGACLDCAVEGLVCTPSGECGPICNSITCFGCCDERNTCQAGTEDAQCGNEGSRCTPCAEGAYCMDSGECQPEVPCLPTTCDGCCDASGLCRGGRLDEACGQGGVACADCAALGGACDEAGGCVEQVQHCEPGTCSGCCDETGQCVAGVTPSVCGIGGAACADCGPEICAGGACQPGCQDRDGDGYGAGCALGPDCDDLAPGITGPCQADGCPSGFVLIPEGEFIMGCDHGDPGCISLADSASPRHAVILTPYCAKVTKVTVAEWRACRQAGYCLESPCDPVERPEVCFYSDAPGENDNYPLMGPTWFAATWQCRAWFGGDVPSEAQWEKAARGVDGRTWPWGNEPEPGCDITYVYGCDEFVRDVGASPAANSPYGLEDTYTTLPEYVIDRFLDPYLDCEDPCVDPIIWPRDLSQPFTCTLRGGLLGYFDNDQYPSIALRYGWPVEAGPSGSGVSYRCVHPVVSP